MNNHPRHTSLKCTIINDSLLFFLIIAFKRMQMIGCVGVGVIVLVYLTSFRFFTSTLSCFLRIERYQTSGKKILS